MSTALEMASVANTPSANTGRTTNSQIDKKTDLERGLGGRGSAFVSWREGRLCKESDWKPISIVIMNAKKSVSVFVYVFTTGVFRLLVVQ